MLIHCCESCRSSIRGVMISAQSHVPFPAVLGRLTGTSRGHEPAPTCRNGSPFPVPKGMKDLLPYKCFMGPEGSGHCPAWLVPSAPLAGLVPTGKSSQKATALRDNPILRIFRYLTS